MDLIVVAASSSMAVLSGMSAVLYVHPMSGQALQGSDTSIVMFMTITLFKHDHFNFRNSIIEYEK